MVLAQARHARRMASAAGAPARKAPHEGAQEGWRPVASFDFSLVTRERCIVAECRGDLDLEGVVSSRDRLSAAAAAGPGLLVMDLGGVSFLDSTALGLFAVLHRRLGERGGVLVLANVDPQVGTPIKMTGLDAVIFVHWTDAGRLSWAGDPAFVVLAHSLGIDEATLTGAHPVAS